MKKDEFINEVEKAISKLDYQGEVCKTKEGLCVYQNKIGQHCIIGFMMPDSDTREKADSYQNPISELYEMGVLEWTDQFNTAQINSMSTLQKVHDEIVIPFHERIDLMQEELERYKSEGQNQ
jgi:hypothetical protein